MKDLGTGSRKVILVLACVFLLLVGVMWQVLTALVLAQTLIVLLIFTKIYVRIASHFVEVERVLPEQSLEDSEVEVRLRVSSSFWLNWVLVEDYFSPDSFPHKRLVISSISRKEGLTLRYRGGCLNGRGSFVVGPVRLYLSDPFGLWLEERELRSTATRLLVLPRLVPLAQLSPLAAQSVSFVGGRTLPRAGISYDFLGTRPYRQGDSLKYIHWPATAHSNELIIKEFESHALCKFSIFLDLHRDSLQGIKPNTLDYAITIGGSIAKFACDRSLEFRLFAHGQRSYSFPFGRGHGHLSWILQELASMKPKGELPLEELVRRNAPLILEKEEVFLLCPTHRFKLVNFVDIFQFLRGREVAITVVFLVSQSFEELYRYQRSQDFLIHSQLPALLSAQGIRVVAVEKGMDISKCFEQGI
ncbi:MAG: DUF58 domain-containing protein [Planctomycetota bacterium]|nr:MAG: DUF58 domain-containing protein [Planctomycetota bacterium]